MPSDDSSFFDIRTNRIRNGGSLTEGEAQRMMELIVRGILSSECIEEYLAALADKGESVDEIVGSARALRAHSVPFAAPGNAIDNCGTGGDGAVTFNISTVAALVLASAGQPVVKHGNRSASGRVGSADLMEALGISIDLDPNASLVALQRFNFAFLFAPQYHPAAKHAAPIRKRLGRPTIFNLLGPLCNPATLPYQLIGVPNFAIAEKISKVISRLGVKRAFVITGKSGIDELIPASGNDVFDVKDGQISHTSFSARDAGLEECAPDDLQGGDVTRNAEIARSVFQGVSGPARNAVLFNAGAALSCTGAAPSLKEGCARCAAAIDRGDSLRLLNDLRALSLDRGVHE